MANPECLGDLMLRVAEKTSATALKEEVAPVPLVKGGGELPGVSTEKPLVPHGGAPMAADVPVEPVGSPSGENTEIYKMFWSKFKRPSGSIVEKPQGGEAASSSGERESVSHLASTEPVHMHRAEEATQALHKEVPAPTPVDVESSPSEMFVENQLGDPTLYPLGPDMAFLTGETATGPSEPDPAGNKDNKMPLDVEDTLKDSPEQNPPHEVMEEHQEKAKVITVEPDTPMGGNANPPSTPLPAAKQQQFVPTHDDLKAAIMRKTTLDLMGPQSPAPTTPAPSPIAEVSAAMGVVPGEMQGFTSVVMTLAGVPQDVWVPLSRADALAAGLVPSDTWEPPEDMTKAVVKASETPKSPTAPAPAPAPAPEPTVAPAQASANADVDGAANEDNAEGKALKAAYMRFHRSVHSSSAALNDLFLGRYLHVKRPGLHPCHK